MRKRVSSLQAVTNHSPNPHFDKGSEASLVMKLRYELFVNSSATRKEGDQGYRHGTHFSLPCTRDESYGVGVLYVVSYLSRI